MLYKRLLGVHTQVSLYEKKSYPKPFFLQQLEGPCTFIVMLPLLDDRSLWTSHDRVEWHTAMSCSELPFTGSDRDVVHALVKSGLLD